MARRIKKKEQQLIGRKRIDQLFTFAEAQAKKGNLTYANNAVSIARRIAMKTTQSLPKHYKHLLCRYCHHYLLPSVTCRIRISNGVKTITCFHCQKRSRYPYKTHK
jgi:RNase P subunit RPR2